MLLLQKQGVPALKKSSTVPHSGTTGLYHVPHGGKDMASENIVVLLGVEQIEALDKRAKQAGTTRSALVRDAVFWYLRNTVGPK